MGFDVSGVIHFQPWSQFVRKEFSKNCFEKFQSVDRNLSFDLSQSVAKNLQISIVRVKTVGGIFKMVLHLSTHPLPASNDLV